VDSFAASGGTAHVIGHLAQHYGVTTKWITADAGFNHGGGNMLQACRVRLDLICGHDFSPQAIAAS
jgi:3-deoxy-D-manno-octulosonic-acid transferase